MSILVSFFLKTPAWAGVWIFFIISGYFAGNGFITNKFGLNRNGILNYYISRLIKIGIPTYFFCFLCCTLFYPDFIFSNKYVLLRMITFTYNGTPGLDGIGATWYISSLMQMYFIAPIFIIIIQKIIKITNDNNVKSWILWFAVLIGGVTIRLLLYKNNADWYSKVYTFSITNLDLFFCGILINYVKKPTQKIYLNIISWCVFIATILSNCYLYLLGELGKPDYIFVYQYIFPSIYVVSISLLILNNRNHEKETGVIKPIDNIVKWFSDISFYFYLWHSLILKIFIKV